MNRVAALIVILALAAGAVPLHRDSLPNGLVVLTYEDHSVPAVDVRLACRSGAARDPENKSGLAGLVADMLWRGSATMDDDSVAAELEFLGARHSSGTDYDYSVVDLKVLTEHLGRGLELLFGGVLSPGFDPLVFERVRASALSSARRTHDSPRAVSMMEFDRLLFAGHPYGRPAGGDTADIQALSLDDARGFHRLNYVPNNCFVVVVGDVAPAEAVRLVAELTAGWQPAEIPALAPPGPTVPTGLRVRLVERPDLTQSYVTLGHPGISMTHPEMLATRLMAYILGGSALGSRFGDAVREQGGLAYDVRCWFDRRSLPGAFRATVQTADPATAIGKMREEIRRMHGEGPTARELAGAKQYYTGSFPLGYSSSGGKLRLVTEAELHGLGSDWLDRFPAMVSNLELDELKQAAARQLDPDNCYITVIGNVTRQELELPGATWLD